MLFWTSIEILVSCQDLPKKLLKFINFIYKNPVPLQDMNLTTSKSPKIVSFSFTLFSIIDICQLLASPLQRLKRKH